ncbi:NAD-dependent epimerase/dehydratase family protein [Kribbella sandramycini]|uniref:NAD-dependent epimerase/dehydratase family protein n=1 Tax=Kribbella sandramycini TaxID=60450 RepID=A0A7Y4KZX4_9ACTN|nr:NAD-dependent epimerase/dehydratase family protein [Kribbella sandramycini]MBB6565488.1 UDP-glucose 4-epimerase [Kribbella sandramycini]NOL41755.1 NAD-dependent epimerase/dehydratase family protein [Kribbella sandramycini]
MAERVLVTGAAGFIGRAVVRGLRERGVAVTAVDREPADEAWDDGVHVVTGDLANQEVCIGAFETRPDAVIHLAALTSVLRSVDAPMQTFAQNLAITQVLLELSRGSGVESFVLASTNAVVGDIGTATISTDLPLRPLTPYGATKAAGEMLLSAYSGSYGLATAALRLTNVYGPGMSHKDSFVPRMMRAALAGTGVQVYGDGSQRRDLVYIDDVVDGVLRAVDTKYDGRAIIGSGRSVSVLELVEAVRTATGQALPVEHIEAPAGEMPAVIVDITNDLGYAPTVSLEDGLARTWQYFQHT